MTIPLSLKKNLENTISRHYTLQICKATCGLFFYGPPTLTPYGPSIQILNNGGKKTHSKYKMCSSIH